MADIFISYSKADRDKLVPLAAYLESEGWTVWWDRHLVAGETYRDEIMTQLATARAVIVLWTQNSISSDFVRAEAGYAKAQAKLIPVKESDVAYGDIPLPFGEMHTEDLSKREMVRGAIVALLAKPQVEPSAWWASTRIVRSEFLTWVGIICGAVTIFSSLQAVLHLSGLARKVVTNWQAWTTAFWQSALGWVGLDIPSVILPVLSFTVFALMMAVGVRIRNGPPVSQLRLPTRGEVLEQLALAIGLLLCFGAIAYYFWEVATVNAFIPFFVIFGMQSFLQLFVQERFEKEEILFIALFVLLSFVLIGPRLLFANLVYMTERTAEAKIARDLFFNQPPLVIIILIVPFVMSLIAPVRGLVKRLTFLTLGVALLAGLNQVALYEAQIRSLISIAQ